MDEPSGNESRPGEDAPAPPAAPASVQGPPSGGQPPSVPPGWEPPWGAPGTPASPPPPSPVAPPPSLGQWRFNPAPPTAAAPPTASPPPPPAPYPSSVQDTGRSGTTPYAGTPPQDPYARGPYGGGAYPGGPYGGGPSNGRPYGGGPYGGGPYGGGPYGGGPYGPGWHPGPTTPPRPVSRGLVATIVVLGVLVAALVGGVVGHGLTTNAGAPSVFNGGGSSSTAPPSGAPSNSAAIAAAIDPDLVDIDTVISSEDVEGAGTGMVLTSTGEILTNNHVIEEADPGQIRVTDIGNGKVYSATVVGYDRNQDVAVLQLTGASGLATVPLGNSSDVSVGQGVVAVGNAGGTGGTPTYAGGTVVATDQTISASDEVDNSSETLTGLIESDADIVAGDSGGPLVNTSGKVVGMDTAASSGFEFANSGTQGYSIPINTAISIARQIEAGDASNSVHVGPTAFLGVGVVNATSTCSGFGGGGGGTTSGALICQVVPGGPAQTAGLTENDVIVALNGQAVTSANSLTNVMSQQKPGATVSVTYVDTSGNQHTVSATLASGAPQ